MTQEEEEERRYIDRDMRVQGVITGGDINNTSDRQILYTTDTVQLIRHS